MSNKRRLTMACMNMFSSMIMFYLAATTGSFVIMLMALVSGLCLLWVAANDYSRVNW